MAASISGPSAVTMTSSSQPPPPPRCTSFVKCTSGTAALGVACDVIGVIAAGIGTATGNPAPLYVVLGANGCAAVGLAALGITTCIWAPERKLEQNVARAKGEVTSLLTENRNLKKSLDDLDLTERRIGEDAASEKASAEKIQGVASKQIEELHTALASLKKTHDEEMAAAKQSLQGAREEIQRIGTLHTAVEADLAKERSENERLRKEATEKVQQLRDLTKQLEAVNQQFSGNQELLRKWESVMAQVSVGISSLKPDALASGVEGITRQMEQFGLSERDLSAKADELKAAAAAVGRTEAAYGESVSKIQASVSELAIDLSQKKEQLTQLRTENERLEATIKKLEADLETIKGKNGELSSLVSQLQGTVSDLNGLAELMQRPDFQEILNKATQNLSK